MKRASKLLLIGLVSLQILSCAHGKIPVIIDPPPKEPYQVIETIEVKEEWHGLHWLWHWWHYMPWYPSIYKIHDKKLVKKARKLNADAVINIKYLPHRQGATAEAIRFKDSEDS